MMEEEQKMEEEEEEEEGLGANKAGREIIQEYCGRMTWYVNDRLVNIYRFVQSPRQRSYGVLQLAGSQTGLYQWSEDVMSCHRD